MVSGAVGRPALILVSQGQFQLLSSQFPVLSFQENGEVGPEEIPAQAELEWGTR